MKQTPPTWHADLNDTLLFLSFLVYSMAPAEVVDPLIYDGLVEELVEVLEMKDPAIQVMGEGLGGPWASYNVKMYCLIMLNLWLPSVCALVIIQ